MPQSRSSGGRGASCPAADLSVKGEDNLTILSFVTMHILHDLSSLTLPLFFPNKDFSLTWTLCRGDTLSYSSNLGQCGTGFHQRKTGESLLGGIWELEFKHSCVFKESVKQFLYRFLKLCKIIEFWMGMLRHTFSPKILNHENIFPKNAYIILF